MNKGKWNYTEDIHYKVVNVRLGSVPDTPLHWQNACVNNIIQAVLIRDGNGQEFLIDNQDGSGLLKLKNGGGPDYYSAHIDGDFEIGCDVPEESWNEWDPHAHYLRCEAIEAWQEEHYPEELKKIRSIKAAWATSPMNPANIKR